MTELSVQERIDAARRAGTPAWLWPEVPPAQWRAALLDIERVVRSLLNAHDSSDELLPSILYGLDAFAVAAYTSGTGPLLGYWVEKARLRVPDEMHELLQTHLDHGRARMAKLTTLTDALLADALRAGIHATVLKGMHTAQMYFPEAGTRPVADIDLLVAAADSAALDGVLTKHGLVVHERQYRPPKTEWRKLGEAVLPMSLTHDHADDPIAVDVHTSLDRDFVGVQTVRLQSVFRESPAHTLEQPLLTLMLAVHASEGLHNLRLIRQIELALVVRMDAESRALDWQEFTEAADEAGAWRFIYPAIELTNQLCPDTFPAAIVERTRKAATPDMRRIIGALTPATAQRIDQLSVDERLMWAGTSAEKIRRLIYGLWPAPAGRSLKRLSGIYAQRAWMLLRGKVGS